MKMGRLAISTLIVLSMCDARRAESVHIDYGESKPVHYTYIICLASLYGKIYAVGHEQVTYMQGMHDCGSWYEGKPFEPRSFKEFVDVIREHNLKESEAKNEQLAVHDERMKFFVNYLFDDNNQLRDKNGTRIAWNKGEQVAGCVNSSVGNCATMSLPYGAICTAGCFHNHYVICESSKLHLLERMPPPCVWKQVDSATGESRTAAVLAATLAIGVLVIAMVTIALYWRSLGIHEPRALSNARVYVRCSRREARERTETTPKYSRLETTV